MGREYIINGKVYLFPRVIARWSTHKKNVVLEETLISVVNGRLFFFLKRTIGKTTSKLRFFPPKEESYRIEHKELSDAEAKAWIKEHLPEDLCKKCLNDWPRGKEEKHVQQI